MKLKGSKQEQDFRKELEGSNLVLAKDGKAEIIMNVLKVTFGELKSAYILNWTPEQGEDIYTILVLTLIKSLKLKLVDSIIRKFL